MAAERDVLADRVAILTGLAAVTDYYTGTADTLYERFSAAIAACGYTLSRSEPESVLDSGPNGEPVYRPSSPEPLPREALTLALVAEALFEARIGAPADALLLAETLYPALVRLLALSPDRPTPP